MLDGSAISPSQSPWWNAMVLVRKKDGSLQFCIDFRCLNARTKKDAYPMSWMQETMESMVGTQHFTCMDLKSGFWQVKMAEESRQYTAFMASSIGVYQFLHMTYDLCKIHATFQCLMQNCLGELNLMYVLIYLKQCDYLLKNRRTTPDLPQSGAGKVHGEQPETQPFQVQLFLDKDQLSKT